MSFSVYGATGFIGGTFCSMFPTQTIRIDRGQRTPMSKDILYFISTTHNYNVFDNITLDVKTNLMVLCEVLERCKDENVTFNFISSWFVYGENESPVAETAICKPTGFYSITKKAAEDLIISFCKTFGVKYRILRLCNVLGNGDNSFSLQKNAITGMIELMKNNREVKLYNDGGDIRDIMHVEDVCRAIHLIITEGEENEIYNVGSGQPTRVGDIINKAKELLGSQSVITSIPTPKFHSIVQTKDFYMDTSKLKSLGFEQTITLDDIIQELCKN